MDIIDAIEDCNFTCEAGPLQQSADWQQLKAIIKNILETASTTEPILDDGGNADDSRDWAWAHADWALAKRFKIQPR